MDLKILGCLAAEPQTKLLNDVPAGTFSNISWVSEFATPSKRFPQVSSSLWAYYTFPGEAHFTFLPVARRLLGEQARIILPDITIMFATVHSCGITKSYCLQEHNIILSGKSHFTLTQSWQITMSEDYIWGESKEVCFRTSRGLWFTFPYFSLAFGITGIRWKHKAKCDHKFRRKMMYPLDLLHTSSQMRWGGGLALISKWGLDFAQPWGGPSGPPITATAIFKTYLTGKKLLFPAGEKIEEKWGE